MSDIADKIYAATGLTLNAEAAAAIGRMIRLARESVLEEAIYEIEMLRAAIIQYVNTVWEHEGVTFINEMPNEILQKVIVKLMNPYFALGEKE